MPKKTSIKPKGKKVVPSQRQGKEENVSSPQPTRLPKKANSKTPASAETTKHMNMELAQITRHNQSILNAANEGIYGLDLNGNTTFLNASATKMTGYSAKELIGQHTHNFIHHLKSDGSHYPEEECPIYAALKDGGIHHIKDEVFLRKDGTSFPVEYISTPVLNSGKIMGAVVTFRDITEQKFMLKEISISKLMFEVLEDSHSLFISNEKSKLIYEKMLSAIRNISDGEYGFIGEVLYSKDGNPYLKTKAMTNISWDAETRKLYAKHSLTGMVFDHLETLFGKVLTTGKPVISNNPSNDPRAGGLPNGHPAMTSFLGVPIKDGKKLIGMMGLANKPNGYNKLDILRLKPFTDLCATFIHANRNFELRVTAEKELIQKQQELEKKNTLLSEILGQLEIEKKQIKDTIKSNIKELSLPLIRKLKDNDKGKYKLYEFLEKSLAEVTSDFGIKISTDKKLSPREIEVCNMVRNGFETKEIASFFGVASATVISHRKKIRAKLGLKNNKINLTSYLRTI